MLDVGVITEVHEATPWINSFVIVETVKDGKKKLRICLDPKPLNKAIMCEPYITRTPDDVYHKLANAKHVTVIDFKKSFWQFVLDEESSYLTTFNTHFWRNLKNFCFLGGGEYISKFFEFSNFFKSFHTNAAENDPQFHLIHNFSHLLPPKHLIFGEISKIFISVGGGVTSANFLSFPTFSNRFTPMWLKMTNNGKFGQKSGLDWVKTANFACFSIFSPKMRLRLTRNGQFHLIHNFSHLLPPKHLIFGEISKFSFLGGVHQQMC